MILIAAAAGNRVEDGAGIAAVLGAELVSYQPDFLNRVRIVQRDRRTGNTEVVVVLTVDHEVVVTRASAV